MLTSCVCTPSKTRKIEKNIERTGRRGRRRIRLVDDRKIARRYCQLKDEALDHTVWRASFERVYGPVVRQTMS